MQPTPEVLRDAGVTRRELDVFWLVGDRLHNREIAERLYVSERTVESHVSSLLRKLGGTSRLSLVREAAQLRNRRASANPLPVPLTSFVGRDREGEDLLRLIRIYRLVTLTGPAGAGKTRLSLQLARSVDALPAALVDLSTVMPGGDVERVFADALGVAGEEGQLRAQLCELLSQRPHWLLVDNCEHVVDSTAALLTDLLTATAELSVLATSHGPLHVAGEVVYEIAPLPMPAEVNDPASVLSAASGRLFADRAATALPGFTVTPDNARDVAAICRRLDGLPLAVELAAARLRLFSPAELLAHLDDRLALLADGDHGIPCRYRTLEAALQWSYELLDEGERRLFERCSVFPGEFDYDTLVEILSYPPLRADVARVFPRLLDRSLVSCRRQGQITEYRMLDSIRHFAHSRLALRGEHETLREQHARYHLHRATATLADLRGANQVDALTWFDHRWPDVRAAMHWALEQDETEAAWEFLAGIGTGWEILGVRGELFDWLGALLDRPLPPAPLGVRAAVTATVLLCYQDTGLALKFAQRAYDTAELTGADDYDLALARLSLGWGMTHNGDPASAIDHLQLAVENFDRLADSWHHALALEGLGHAEQDPEVALAYLEHSADLFGRMRDHVKRSNCLNEMVRRSIDVRAHLEDAPRWLMEARRLADGTGNDTERLHAELLQARLDDCRGEHKLAGPQLERLLAEFRRVGDRRCMSRCLLGLGQMAMRDNDHTSARHHLAESITIAELAGDTLVVTDGLCLLAESYRTTGDPQYAGALLGAADSAAGHLDAARRDALPAHHELRVMLRDELGADAFTSAVTAGHQTSLARLLSQLTLNPAG